MLMPALLSCLKFRAIQQEPRAMAVPPPVASERELREHPLLQPACHKPLTGKETHMFRTIIAVALIAFFAGCNTMAGAGKDIERGGEKIQGSAERNR
jgi:predicted small secreted protein